MFKDIDMQLENLQDFLRAEFDDAIVSSNEAYCLPIEEAKIIAGERDLSDYYATYDSTYFYKSVVAKMNNWKKKLAKLAKKLDAIRVGDIGYDEMRYKMLCLKDTLDDMTIIQYEGFIEMLEDFYKSIFEEYDDGLMRKYDLNEAEKRIIMEENRKWKINDQLPRAERRQEGLFNCRINEIFAARMKVIGLNGCVRNEICNVMEEFSDIERKYIEEIYGKNTSESEEKCAA